MDHIAQSYSPIRAIDSNPGFVHHSLGGVAANIAIALSRCGCRVSLGTLLGRDTDGNRVLDLLNSENVDTEPVQLHETQPTASYVALHGNHGNLHAAIACMDIYDNMTTVHLGNMASTIGQPDLIVVDGNLPATFLENVLENLSGIFTIAVAVSASKIERFKPILANIDLLICNSIEARQLSNVDDDKPLEQHCTELMSHGLRNAIVTDGSKPTYYWSNESIKSKSVPDTEIVSTNGAGDMFATGVIFHICRTRLQLSPARLCSAVETGHKLAALALSGIDAVPDKKLIHQAIS